MNARQLKRLAALARGPVLLIGAAACAEQQTPGGSNVVTAPTTTAAAAADPGAPTAAPGTDATEAGAGDTPDAGGRPWRRPINAPRWQDGGRAGGPRPPVLNAMPTNKPGDAPPNP